MRITRKITLATFFGILVFLSKTFMPTPIDKILILPQPLFLTLGYLTSGFLGATYTSLIGGMLTAIWRASFAPFTILFATLYGLLIDVLCRLFGVKPGLVREIKRNRLVIAVTIATVIIGLLSYYITVYIFMLLPRNIMLEVGILIAGTINGIVAGYLTFYVWKKIYKILLRDVP